MSTDSAQLLLQLPDGLQERTEVLKGGMIGKSTFVLYWMQTAQRADENPALEVGIALANQLGIPCFVYQSLSETYSYSCDRHHHFLLSGAAKVSKALASRGIGYAFHLDRAKNRGPVLKQLANMASAIITENLPTPEFRQRCHRLSLATDSPIWKVDTACIVPMSLSRVNYKSIVEYAEDTEKWRMSRIFRTWMPLAPEQPATIPSLPFLPVAFGSQNISELIAECAIDHSIPAIEYPNPMKTWTSFRQTHIHRYHFERNTNASHRGSHLSAHLHYGQISPFTMARESAQLKGRGPARFLESLVLWREFSYHWCHRNLYHEENLWNWVPSWAKESFSTRNPYCYEELYRANSPDERWNYCQQQLLQTGHLHHSLRKYWGRMSLLWSVSGQQGMERLIDLNSRLAIDGKDPTSYIGILWCFGLFDKPTPKPTSLGKLREPAFPRTENRPEKSIPSQSSSKANVIVLGGGMSALMATRTLRDNGFSCMMYSTHIGNSKGNENILSCIPFNIDKRPFKQQLSRWAEQKLLWPKAGKIGILHNNQITESPTRFYSCHYRSLHHHLAKDLPIQPGSQIHRIRRSLKAWHLYDKEDKQVATCEELIIAETDYLRLLPPVLQTIVPKVQTSPRIFLQIQFTAPLETHWSGVVFSHAKINWAVQLEGNNHFWVLSCNQFDEEQLFSSQGDLAQLFLTLLSVRGAQIVEAGLKVLTIPGTNENASIARRDSTLQLNVCPNDPYQMIDSALAGVSAAGKIMAFNSKK